MKLKKFSVKQLYLPQTFCANTLQFPRVQNGFISRDVTTSLLNLRRTEKSLYSSKSTTILKRPQSRTTLLSNLTMREGNKVNKFKDIGINTPEKNKKKNLSPKEVDFYHYHIFGTRDKKKITKPITNAFKNSVSDSLNTLIQKTYFMDKTVKFLYSQMTNCKLKLKKKYYEENMPKKQFFKIKNKFRRKGVPKIEDDNEVISGVFRLRRNNSAIVTNITLHSKYPKFNSNTYTLKSKPLIYF